MQQMLLIAQMTKEILFHKWGAPIVQDLHVWFEAAIERHLAAFKSELLTPTRTRVGTVVATTSCSTVAATRSTTDPVTVWAGGSLVGHIVNVHSFTPLSAKTVSRVLS